ncbi:MAG: peptide-methionine (S)-S-oxide reductase MsrA [Capsulimonadaceae bacterium]|nr:peptide-methionine (S)-S-oxide reductase MsrA [Capsulimonadaceae bacterium]
MMILRQFFCAVILSAACGCVALAAEPSSKASVLPPPGREIATLAGGCFWAMEARFKLLKGVDSVTPGYAGGRIPKPTYEQVCSESTGYAETVQIVFDPKVVSYHDLVDIFMRAHNPTTKDRQGNDVGSSYRSVIFYQDARQKAIAEGVIHEIEKARVWSGAIVTEISPLTAFYPAEAYHDDYYARHPENTYCRFVVGPEVDKFRRDNRARLK